MQHHKNTGNTLLHNRVITFTIGRLQPRCCEFQHLIATATCTLRPSQGGFPMLQAAASVSGRKDFPDMTASLLKWHNRHRGIYARVARKHNVDPSFVSRVANGERTSAAVKKSLVAELR